MEVNVRGRLNRLGATLSAAGPLTCLAEIQSHDPEELSARYFDELLRHAVAHVPYYAQCADRPLELSSFPILTRRLLRDNTEQLRSDDLQQRRHATAATGGSTGEPVWVTHDRTFSDWDKATDLYFISTVLGMPVGYYLSHRRLILWHSRESKLNLSPASVVSRLLGQCIRLEPYTILTEATVRAYVRTINRVRPVMIWAYAGPLFEVARMARRQGLRMHRPRFIISSVEMLYPHMRTAIQEVFGCPVHDYYGSAETGRVAAECPHGRLHLFTFNNHMEVLDAEGRHVGPGEEGRLVLTPLHNLAMPLIRYDIGDMARMGSGTCTCGNPLPVLDGITGRVIEHFVTMDGDLVYGGNFIAMFYEHDWVAELQILQEERDLIKVFFKRMPGREVPQETIDRLSAHMREIIGEGCRVEWHEVEHIPRTPIGKHLHARSLVWEEGDYGS